MKISAHIKSSRHSHQTIVASNAVEKHVQIPVKQNGFGAAVNGGEMLAMALATCYCNDLYREAAKRNIEIDGISVHVFCDFDSEGEAGTNFTYKAHVDSSAPASEITELIRHTDTVAEIHNTLRKGVTVRLTLP